MILIGYGFVQKEILSQRGALCSMRLKDFLFPPRVLSSAGVKTFTYNN